MHLEQRLTELSITLPASAAAGAKYTPGVVFENLAWISGQLPRDGDRVLVAGKLGRDVSIEQAKEGARMALIRALAALRETLGNLDRVQQILKLNVFVNSSDDFTQHSAVADGASELIFELFGPEGGKHARTSEGGRSWASGANRFVRRQLAAGKRPNVSSSQHVVKYDRCGGRRIGKGSNGGNTESHSDAHMGQISAQINRLGSI
jgi:enamine deaminase RidA (YjgF/YER057c/UK114 family)